jgi:cellulose synthase/poly-beta-1,6-N-acetylglucosamine synthase-like glycosyltransferase
MATMLYHNGPAVSVLVAARNEETNIGACLAALLDQEFLPERFEIWVGDDDSQDHTAFIVNEMRKSDPRIHLLPISEKRTGMPGKANVLAQLAHYAKGDLILITDADVRVGTGWIRTMVECFTPDIDMISGVVTLYGRSLFAQLQNADWLFFCCRVH